MAGPGAEASPTTFTVNSTADPGDGTCDATECTLREAIAAANANAGTDTIDFDIPGTGPRTIQPASALPDITDPVTIDGYTQPGATPNTNPPGSGSNAVLRIELDGTNAGANANGLTITAGNSTVKGLVINRFAGTGSGVLLQTNGGNVIEGNYIGTDVNGTADLGNTSWGVYISGARSNTIGGTAAGAGNVISGNDGYGVYIAGSGASENQVQGNYIGTDKNGTSALGNSSVGVYIYLPSGNTIGGTTAEARNVISGNAYGVFISGSGTSGNQVQGNYIGTDVTGTAALGNSNTGVFIYDAPSNTIGGRAAGTGNVISGNGSVGVYITRSGSTGNQVQGNLIGTDKDGISALGNASHGVLIEWGPTLNTIGGTAAGAGNTIAHNGGDGARVLGASATGNTTRGNSIHSNSGKGIENINGGNTELAPPTITGFGSVMGTACPNCTVDVYSDDEDEGRVYEGSTTANGAGNWSFGGSLDGPNITATATDSGGNTSEFSAPVAYSPPIPVGGIARLPDASASSARSYTALAGLAAAAVVALTAAAWYARRRWLG